jgi:hypothetical protein
MTLIWITYAVINILWQFGVSYLIKQGFVQGDLKWKNPDAYEQVVNRSKRKHQPMETAFRNLATIGMNLWLLPIALISSILVLLLQQA